MILLSVSITLLLLMNNHISLHQSLNFVLFLSNHSEFETMFLGITAYSLVFVIIGTGTSDITVSDCSIVSSEDLFVICKDSICSDSTSMLSILFELILVPFMVYTTHVLFII